MSEAEDTADLPPSNPDPGMGPPMKSSSEILNELFSSFNSSFDDEVPMNMNSDVDSTPSQDKKIHKEKKHQDMATDETERKISKKKDKKIRSPSTEKPSRSPPKSSSKRNAPAVDKASNDSEVSGKKLESCKSTKSLEVRVKPDPELEGEIADEAEERAERKWHLRKREASHDSEQEPALCSSKHSRKESSSWKSRGSLSKDAKRCATSHTSSGRRRDPSPQRSRSFPVRLSAPPRKHYSGYKALSREKAHDSEVLDKNYYNSNVGRRNPDYSYVVEKRYSGGHGGFGYSGSSSSRYDKNHYDYRKSGSCRSSYRSSGRRSMSPRYHSRSRNRSRSHSKTRVRSLLRRLHPDDIIDKAKLLEMARENASKLTSSGVLPSDMFSLDQIRDITAGGKSVERLTEHCKKVTKHYSMEDAFDRNNSSDEDERLIHSPLMVVDRPKPSIRMNIRNAIPLSVMSPRELATENAKLKVQFPVSSRTQHRYRRIECKPAPVDKDDANSKALIPLKKSPQVGTVFPMPQETDEATSGFTSSEPLAITEGTGSSPTAFGVSQVDIASVISKRLRATIEVQQDPDSVAAKEELESATQEIREWAKVKALEQSLMRADRVI